MKTINLGERIIGDGYATFVIAEIGINHQGDVRIARQLIEQACDSGADAVKFQKRKISRILTQEGLEMPYMNPNSFGKTYGEHKRALELNETEYEELINFTNELGMIFLASGWDEDSIDFLDELGVPGFKMASADLTNFPLLAHAADKNKPIILSTGMADMDMVKLAYEHVTKITDQVAILQCTSTYPTSFPELHLSVISEFKKEFPDAVIGYSGHELGIAIPPVAVALGARIIERHFTLDRTMKGNDHAASLEPQGFAKMVRDIRHVEKAMGTPVKRVQPSEVPVFEKLAKSIVSSCRIPAGTIINRDMLTTKGPGTGISPTRLDEIIGLKSKIDIPDDTVIHESDLDFQES